MNLKKIYLALAAFLTIAAASVSHGASLQKELNTALTYEKFTQLIETHLGEMFEDSGMIDDVDMSNRMKNRLKEGQKQDVLFLKKLIKLETNNYYSDLDGFTIFVLREFDFRGDPAVRIVVRTSANGSGEQKISKLMVLVKKALVKAKLPLSAQLEARIIGARGFIDLPMLPLSNKNINFPNIKMAHFIKEMARLANSASQ